MESRRLNSMEHGIYEQHGKKIDLRFQAVNELATNTMFPIPLYIGPSWDPENAIGQVDGVMGGYEFVQVLAQIFDGKDVDTSEWYGLIPSVAFKGSRQEAFAFFFFTSGIPLKPVEMEDHDSARLG